MKSCLLFSASAAASAFGFHHTNERSLLLGLKKVGRYYRQQHVKNQWREPSEQRVLLFQRKKTSQPFGSADNQSLLFGKGGGVVEVDDETETPIVVINGTAPGLIVTDVYRVPLEGFLDDANDSITLSKLFSTEDITRLRLVSQNVTLPAALMMLDPGKYPTQSRARKAIRQRSICICRRRRRRRDDENDETTHEFDEMGKVIARIYPGDVIGFQRRAGSDYIAIEGAPYRLPAFEVPVIFEDDHMAIVNKPAGIVVYRAEGGRGGGARAGGHGRDTLMSALSFVLMPSNFTDDDENVPLKRPHAVHRLDRPTSGLMVVAKTKAAAVHLAQQFEFRKAKKTYMAIVNGSPISHENEESSSDWNIIDHDLDEKSALTKWRQIQKVDSLRGRNGQLALVELKPKTGV
jgi:23S rRNA-/tRNA-specific pseudouridylate synthase